MTRKYVSLEHSIRNVITESVGVGTGEFQGTPPGFDARYSSMKGKRAAPPSMGAARNSSLTKLSQTGGSMRAEGAELAEKAEQKAKENQGDDKANLDIVKKSPLVKHRTFYDQLMNPQGKAHPSIQPPMPAMNIPPAPEQQQMMPREAGLPSTTPGAVPTSQMARKEGGDILSQPLGDESETKKKGTSAPAIGTGVGGAAGAGAGAAANPVAAHAGSAAAAAGVAHALGNLLHQHSQQIAQTPPPLHHPGAVQGANPAPTLNEPQKAEKANWRDERRTGQTQSQIPGMIQRDQGKVPGGPGHTNPGEAQKGALSHLLGIDQPRQGKAGAQSGPVDPNAPGMPSFQPPESQADPKHFKGPKVDQNSPGMPSFQPPEGQTPAWMSKRGGLSADDKTPGVPSSHSPESMTPPSMSKGPGAAMAAPLVKAATDYMDKAGPPPKAGSLHVGKAKSDEKDEKAPDKSDDKVPDKKNWRDEPGRRTGKTQGEQPGMIQRDPGTHGPDNDPDKTHSNKGERAKAGMSPPGELPRQGKAGAQSGGGGERGPRKDAPLDKDNPSAAGVAPATSGNWRDQPGRRTGKTQGEQPDQQQRDPGTHGPDNPGDTHRPNPGEKEKGAFPKGGINRPENQGLPDYMEPAGAPPSGGNLNKEKQKASDITGVKQPSWWDRIRGKETQAQRDQYNIGKDQQYKDENPGGPPHAWIADVAKKYGWAAAVAAGLWFAHKAEGKMGGSGGGGEKESKLSYLRPKIHDQPAWDMPTRTTQKMRLRSMQMHSEETSHKDTKERRKIGFIERGAGTNERKKIEHTKRPHDNADEGTKERRSVEYLERRGSGKESRHRFSSKTLQGRETYAGMDEERMTNIMREAISDAKAKKKTEGGFGKTKIDTKPKLNPEPLDSLRGP